MSLGAARNVVYVRSRGYCEHCGERLDGGWQLHHRLAGGIGGTSRERDVPSNLLALTSWHHNMHQASVHANGDRSRRDGFLISQHDERPFTDIPVRLWGGRFVLLDDVGGFVPVEAGSARNA